MTARAAAGRARGTLHTSTQAGFTLIEVLVALAIIGVALAAILRTTGMLITNNGELRDRSLAMLSARNQIVELQVNPPADASGGIRAPCPQGPLKLTCDVRVTRPQDGARIATVVVYRQDHPTPQLATLSAVLETAE